MKKLFLVSSVIVSIAIAPVAQAKQLATFDASNAANTLATVNQLKNQALQLKEQYDKLQEQLGVAKDAYNAVSHGPESALNFAAQKLNVPELRQALGDVQDLRDVLSSDNVPGALGAMASDYLERNRVYAPAEEAAGTSVLNSAAKDIAKDQATANMMWTSASKHIEALQDLESQLASAKDTKATADIAARLQAESAYLQAQQIQMQSLAMMQAAEERNKRQQAAELNRKQLDEALAEVRAKVKK